MTITVERNLKVFHPYWSKTNLNHWMIYAAMVFAWIAGTLSIAPIIAHLDSSLCWGRNVPDIFLVGKYKIQDDIPLLDHLLVLTSSRGRVCFLLQSHSGRHEKTGARAGGTQRRGFSTDEHLAGSVQANQVEHHQDNDYCPVSYTHLTLPTIYSV